MSVVTATRRLSAPRSGLIYSPTTLAAADPVWLHPMPDGNYLIVFSKRLTNATPSPRMLQDVMLYDNYVEDVAPSWAVVGPKTGEIHDVGLIPSEQHGVRTVVAAASRGSYLFVLNSYKESAEDTDTYALLQNFRVIGRRGITLLGEERVPADLALGLYVDNRHLWVFGDDGSGNLAMARKSWARIGTDADANPIMNWQFWGGGSWNTDKSRLLPLLTDKGKKIVADGPCSMARYRDNYYLMNTEATKHPVTEPAGTARLSMAVNNDGTRLYVADYDTSTVYAISVDIKDGLPVAKIIKTIKTRGGPCAMTFNPAGDKLYLSNNLDSTVTVVDPETNKNIAEITLGKGPTAMVFHPTEPVLYAVGTSANHVAVVNTETNQVITTITVGEKPYGITINSTGTRLYVTNRLGSSVSIINTTTKKVIKTSSVGSVNAPKSIVYQNSSILLGGTDMLLRFNPVTNRVTDGWNVLNVGTNMAVSSTNMVYLANTMDSISVLDPTGDDFIKKVIATGTDLGVVQVLLRPDQEWLFATNTHDQTVSIIDTATNTVKSVVALSTPVSSVPNQLKSIIDKINALLNGIINGFLGITTGAIGMIADLFGQAVTVITGQTNTIGQTVKDQVASLLNALAGLGQAITDPGAIIANIIATLSGMSTPQGIIATAQDFVRGTIYTVLGLVQDVVTLNPIKLLEDIIRAITGILVGTGNTDSAAGGITIGTSQASLTPESSWQSTLYASRRVEQNWKTHGYTNPIAKTTTLYQGGACLQPQIPLTPGYGVIRATAEVTGLNEYSNHKQLVTGTSPHTVILPPTGKEVGTTISTEGALLVPISPTDFLPTLIIEDATVNEGNFLSNTQVKFRVSLSSSVAQKVTVKYATASSSAQHPATPGNDFEPISGSLTFEPGIVSQQVTVSIKGDSTFEPDEIFLITLSDPVNAQISRETAECTIVNDDKQTLIEQLLSDFQNIVNGIISGAIKVGSSIVTAVTAILEQSARTLTGVVGETGSLVYSAVDEFLTLISGNAVTLPGDTTPAEHLANIFVLITGGAGAITDTIATLANNLYSAITGTVGTVVGGVVDIFQDLIGNIFGLFGLGGAMPMSLMSVSGAVSLASASTPATDPVNYMPYTIHNQSTADILVMPSSRDKSVIVPHGTGMTFTPYASEPTQLKNWSWTYASERAPRARQGFPFITTTRLYYNIYTIAITGGPTAGVFRLIHDGHVSEKVELTGSAENIADSLRRAIASLGSVLSYTVTAVDSRSFTVEIPEDCSTLNFYSYRLVGGTNPKVEVILDTSDSTLLTRWSVLEPDPQPAAPSAVVKEIPTATPDEAPTGLAELLEQFAKIITVVSDGVLNTGTGVVDTVTDIVAQAVSLITGQPVDNTTGQVTSQVTDFLQKLAISPGVSDDAASAFESIVRQITGGTGSTALETIPSPLDFITNAVGGTLENLADSFLKIINAILGK